MAALLIPEPIFEADFLDCETQGHGREKVSDPEGDPNAGQVSRSKCPRHDSIRERVGEMVYSAIAPPHPADEI